MEWEIKGSRQNLGYGLVNGRTVIEGDGKADLPDAAGWDDDTFHQIMNEVDYRCHWRILSGEAIGAAMQIEEPRGAQRRLLVTIWYTKAELDQFAGPLSGLFAPGSEAVYTLAMPAPGFRKNEAPTPQKPMTYGEFLHQRKEYTYALEEGQIPNFMIKSAT